MSYADGSERRYADEYRRHEDHYAEYEAERLQKRRRFSPPAFVAPVSLRLVKKDSSRSPLPANQYLALLDPATQTSIGRDRSFDSRIRLKELAVSKAHATLFWMKGDRDSPASWAITDCGSQAGTHIQRVDSEEWQRISEPRMASKPWRIGHLDRIKICSTVFTAHVHNPPCDVCSIAADDSNLIPTIALPETASTAQSAVEPSSLQSSSRESREETIKRDMKDLRAHLMAKPRQAAKEVDAPKVDYIDRAKLRRSIHGSSIAPSQNTAPVQQPRPPAKRSLEETKGYEMLSKLSGPLGKASDLSQPIDARTLGDGRAGLGSREVVDAQAFAAERQPGGAGYAEAKRRRWNEFSKK